MSNHNGNANKMVSDTPRTDDESFFMFHSRYDFCKADLARQLERELNAANESFRKLNIHALDLAARIKRLEEAGDKMDETAEPFVLASIDADSDEGPIPMSDVGEQYEITYDSPPTAGDHVAMDRARKEWRKAKEAKP